MSPSTPVSPITPTRPPRPALTSTPTSRSLPPLTPDTDSPFRTPTFGSPSTPETPTPVPSAYRPQNSRRKSTASISSRRKPVPLGEEYEIALEEIRGRSLDHPTPPTSSSDPFTDTRYASSPRLPLTRTLTTSEPPRYVLDVAAPPLYHPHTSTVRPVFIESGLPSLASSREQLPVYAEDVQTEPDTLARKCWLWGFLFPLLWLVGMAILCIPLKPTEEEEDVDKAQKLEEMIVILREVELKYARRCMWSFAILMAIITGAVVIAVIVSRFK